ncbi:AEC family transporter [Corynebacterium caspium]|uniref:AEC family transporter n=1 Tax=Corynebacterium caspium TaxID=234828 RepID=UPI00036DFD6E|nr:AEC family transporter [Corynebacterium caspium]WKD58877.1 putative transporter YfdV [Corynebacterium caspium DSM 44850]
MLHVLSGFGVVIIVMAIGYALARSEILGPGARRSFALFVYTVATPALLFEKLTHTDPRTVFGAPILVAASSAILLGVVVACSMWLLYKWRPDEAIIAALGASYANAGNLGIPLAAYILGDAAVVVPVMLFQIAIYAPVSLTAIDIIQHGSGLKWAGHLRGAVGTALKNPMLLAALLGVVCASTNVAIPALISEPISLVAAACVPLALIVFGMSLYKSRPQLSVAVVVIALLKNILHPVIAGLIGAFIFGLSGQSLETVIVLAALPTAQNVYTYAVRFQVKEEFARDIGVVSTVLSVPSILGIALLLGG